MTAVASFNLRSALCTAAALALGFGLAGAPAALAQQQTKVIVGGAATTTQTLGVYYSSLPLEIYWKEEGLDVEFIGLPGLNAALQALETGKVHVVPGSNSALFALIEKYPDIGMKAFFTHTSAFSSMMPAVPADSPLTTVADLEGKTVGVQTLAASQVKLTQALLQLAGRNPASVSFIAVGEGVEAAHALQTKRVDALALFDGLYAAIESEGTKLRELTSDFVDRDKVGFFAALIARQDYIAKNRDTVVRLGRGVAKSVLFAQTNPEAAVRIHWKVYPATKPRGLSEEDAMRKSLMPLQARLKNVEMPGDLFGNSTDTQIEGYMKLLVAGGLMKKPMPISTFWDPSLLKEINDFDREKVKQQAREWKP
jgi:NitT/TauT family transport system substrate-binding protein